MKRRCLCWILAGCLLLGAGTDVHAEDYKGRDGWKVEFTGKRMKSNFTTKYLSDAVYALQPGDSVTLGLTLSNKDGRASDWYMTNEVLSSLEDSQKAADGGAYTYILTYTDSRGRDTVLYSSESVGGEKRTKAGPGLHEATDNLEDYFYLDRLGAGNSGRVKLQVALDGETQGNAYQDTLARLQMNFAVEKLSGSSSRTPRHGEEPEPTPSGRIYTPGGVQTGDSSGVLLWSASALISGLLLILYAFLAQRGRRREEI